MRCTGACSFSASRTKRTSRCIEASAPTFVARISIAPKPFTVPPNTSEPSRLSTGSDSPVSIASSTAVAPVSTTPSAGIVSPGCTLRRSPTRISSAVTISVSPASLIRRPCAGVCAKICSKPRRARCTVRPSSHSPNAMIHATSVAANTSPNATQATSAIPTKSHDVNSFSFTRFSIPPNNSGMPANKSTPQPGSYICKKVLFVKCPCALTSSSTVISTIMRGLSAHSHQRSHIVPPCQIHSVSLQCKYLMNTLFLICFHCKKYLVT